MRMSPSTYQATQTAARRSAAAAFATGAIASIALLATGCYERAVETRGLGASGTSTYEPTQPTMLDRLIDGPNQNSDSQRRYRSN